MSCEHIQEMLMSDYHDGRLSAKLRKDVDLHLTKCAACRQLSERVYAHAIKPFNQAASPMPDEFNWQQIRRRIEQQAAPAPRPAFAWGFRPALAGLSLCMMFLVGGVVWQQYNAQKTPYVSYMLLTDNETTDEVSGNIETYFL